MSIHRRDTETDWNRVEALHDEDIDFSDIPKVTVEQFARAVVRKGLRPVPRKKQVTLRLDEDVLSWLKAQGPRYQTRINQVLRAFMDATRSK